MSVFGPKTRQINDHKSDARVNHQRTVAFPAIRLLLPDPM